MFGKTRIFQANNQLQYFYLPHRFFFYRFSNLDALHLNLPPNDLNLKIQQNILYCL